MQTSERRAHDTRLLIGKRGCVGRARRRGGPAIPVGWILLASGVIGPVGAFSSRHHLHFFWSPISLALALNGVSALMFARCAPCTRAAIYISWHDIEAELFERPREDRPQCHDTRPIDERNFEKDHTVSMPHIRHEVAYMRAETRYQIGEAEARLRGGNYRDRVDAAGELIALRSKGKMLEERLKEIDSQPDASETLVQWIKEELFNLNIQLESWIGRAP